MTEMRVAINHHAFVNLQRNGHALAVRLQLNVRNIAHNHAGEQNRCPQLEPADIGCMQAQAVRAAKNATMPLLN